MPVIQLPSHSVVPMLGQPAKVLGMTILVVVQCQQCDAGEDVALVNAQPAVCPSCGAVVNLDSVSWSKQHPVPKITLSATPPRTQMLSS